MPPPGGTVEGRVPPAPRVVPPAAPGPPEAEAEAASAPVVAAVVVPVAIAIAVAVPVPVVVARIGAVARAGAGSGAVRGQVGTFEASKAASGSLAVPNWSGSRCGPRPRVPWSKSVRARSVRRAFPHGRLRARCAGSGHGPWRRAPRAARAPLGQGDSVEADSPASTRAEAARWRRGCRCARRCDWRWPSPPSGAACCRPGRRSAGSRPA